MHEQSVGVLDISLNQRSGLFYLGHQSQQRVKQGVGPVHDVLLASELPRVVTGASHRRHKQHGAGGNGAHGPTRRSPGFCLPPRGTGRTPHHHLRGDLPPSRDGLLDLLWLSLPGRLPLLLGEGWRATKLIFSPYYLHCLQFGQWDVGADKMPFARFLPEWRCHLADGPHLLRNAILINPARHFLCVHLEEGGVFLLTNGAHLSEAARMEGAT
jgi:hypothetical protein